MAEILDIVPDSPEEHPARSWKQGVRVLGVAESFDRGQEHSVVVGVVMRGDLRVDGLGVCFPEVGGTDSTDRLLEMVERVSRPDIRAWMLGGSVISWFNVVDLNRLHEETGLPVISVTYQPSNGISKYLREYFPSDWGTREQIIERNGTRRAVILRTGCRAYLNAVGLRLPDAVSLVNMFTLDGRVPEPIRLARVVASALRRDLPLLP